MTNLLAIYPSGDSTRTTNDTNHDTNSIPRVGSNKDQSILGQPYFLPISNSNKSLALNTPRKDPTSDIPTTPKILEINLEPLSGGDEDTKSVCVVWEHQDAGVWLDFLQDTSTQYLSTVENMQGKLQSLSDEINYFSDPLTPLTIGTYQSINLDSISRVPTNSQSTRLVACFVAVMAVLLMYLYSSSYDASMYSYVISPS